MAAACPCICRLCWAPCRTSAMPPAGWATRKLRLGTGTPTCSAAGGFAAAGGSWAGIASLSSQPASCFLLLIHPPTPSLIPPAATCTCACCATRSCTACPSTRWTQTRCCRQAASVLLLRCWHLVTRCALLSALVAGFATACCFAASVLCTPHFATATLLPSQWPCPQERRMDLAHSAAVVLDRHNLVKYDRRSGNLQATDLGRCGYVARCSRERQPA